MTIGCTRRGCAIFGVLVFCCAIVFSAPRDEIPPYRVQVKVSGDADLRGQMTSCLTSALRKLPDVTVMDDRPDYELRVIAMKVVTESRKNVGLSVSVLVTAPYTTRVERLTRDFVQAESRPQVLSTLAGAVDIVSHWIEIGSVKQVQQMCQSIVAAFDGETLAKVRILERRRPGPE